MRLLVLLALLAGTASAEVFVLVARHWDSSVPAYCSWAKRATAGQVVNPDGTLNLTAVVVTGCAVNHAPGTWLVRTAEYRTKKELEGAITELPEGDEIVAAYKGEPLVIERKERIEIKPQPPAERRVTEWKLK